MLLAIDEAVMVLVNDVVYGFGRLGVGDVGTSVSGRNSSAVYCEGGLVGAVGFVGGSERYLRSHWGKTNRV